MQLTPVSMPSLIGLQMSPATQGKLKQLDKERFYALADRASDVTFTVENDMSDWQRVSMPSLIGLQISLSGSYVLHLKEIMFLCPR